LSLVLSCWLKRIFAKLSYWRGVSAIAAMQVGIAFLFWHAHQALGAILPASHSISPWHFVIFFLAATGVVLYYFDLRARSLAPAITEARLQALQARIRPHFLFNSINAVLSLIRGEPRRAERMLEDMAELFRVLMADNRHLKPLADEIELCQRYLEIEQIRLGERLSVDWRTDQMPADALVPPLILQPLIENAVYHGVEPHPGPGTITIEIVASGRLLIMTLTNPFRANSTHVTGNRMAIANIRERLQLHFDAEASLDAKTANQQYIVTIKMPIMTRDDSRWHA
jgi:two-component system, LytTR family, sensor histidine kinase AlgZ